MQHKNPSISDFVTRTDALAVHLGLSVSQLAERIGVSKDMLMGYRTGRYQLTAKAWAKLNAVEKESVKDVYEITKKAVAAASGEELSEGILRRYKYLMDKAKTADDKGLQDVAESTLSFETAVLVELADAREKLANVRTRLGSLLNEL